MREDLHPKYIKAHHGRRVAELLTAIPDVRSLMLFGETTTVSLLVPLKISELMLLFFVASDALLFFFYRIKRLLVAFSGGGVNELRNVTRLKLRVTRLLRFPDVL